MTTALAPSRMHARATLSTELVTDGRGASRTRVAAMRSQAPLKLRPTIAARQEPWAAHAGDFTRVCVAAAAAGPIGGDQLHLDVTVGAGSSLVLTEASASLLLPGHDGAESRLAVTVTVEAGGTFVWLPEPVIAARGCRHVNAVSVDMAEDARILLREELILGRKDEPSGQLHQTVRVRRGGVPLHAQDLELGDDTGPAVSGGNRAVGSLLVVDPGLAAPSASLLGAEGVLMPLAAEGAVLASALGADSRSVQHQLGEALALLGRPWDPTPTTTTEPVTTTGHPDPTVTTEEKR